MASVTLGQHPARQLHHLDTDKLFLQKLASGGKKLIRRASREKTTRKVTVDAARNDSLERKRQTQQQQQQQRRPSSDNLRGEGRSPETRTDREGGTNAERERGNGNGNAGRRSSMREARRRSSSIYAADAEEGELLQLDRLTQRKRGVVKLMCERPRRQARSIFAQPEDPRVRPERGEGHLFLPQPVVTEDWCDACNRGVKSAARKCKYCSYTCHLECESLVQLDCNQRAGDTGQRDSSAPCTSYTPPAPQLQNASQEDVEEKPKTLSEEEIRTKIEEYNSKVSENGMSLAADGSYTGFIKVHLKLRRPVTVLSGEGRDSAGDASDQRTSFYLPSDAIKQLHVSSSTTVSEVICGLLKKFMVQDNPRKFALYRQTHRDSQDLFQKLSDSEHPLYLRLLAGPDLDNLSFVLKENETGEVEWHAFSLPELQNFLAILEKEESERVNQVLRRYETYRQKLSEALREVQNKPD